MIGHQPPERWPWGFLRSQVLERGAWRLDWVSPPARAQAAELAAQHGLSLIALDACSVELRVLESIHGGPVGPRAGRPKP